MNAKTLVNGLLAGVLTFLLGWLIFGLLFMDYYSQHMMQYAGLMKNPPEFVYIFIGTLAYGILLSYVFTMGNVASASKGAMAGLVIGILAQINFDTIIFAEFNLMGRGLMALDICLNAIVSSVVGAFLGWWMGRKSV